MEQREGAQRVISELCSYLVSETTCEQSELVEGLGMW